MTFTDSAKAALHSIDPAVNPAVNPIRGAAMANQYKNFVFDKKDGFHGAAGAGLRFIMNQNFIVAFEYARCFNKQDGNGAFYINTGFLF
jgi:hypothetical protein